MRRVLAVSSGGGHLVEMRRIMPAFAGFDVAYACTEPEADADMTGHRYYPIRDVTRRDRFGFAVVAWQVIGILRHERPEVVVTTGSAPGLIALALAKAFCRSRTVWIDCISQVETMSLSGRLARPVADAWLTQWEHLARPGGPEFWGAVL
jgi:UDP-N-acetylglucosamine:LPS N-acetylglucosamine transferase